MRAPLGERVRHIRSTTCSEVAFGTFATEPWSIPLGQTQGESAQRIEGAASRRRRCQTRVPPRQRENGTASRHLLECTEAILLGEYTELYFPITGATIRLL